jgi:hypothetical protein
MTAASRCNENCKIHLDEVNLLYSRWLSHASRFQVRTPSVREDEFRGRAKRSLFLGIEWKASRETLNA